MSTVESPVNLPGGDATKGRFEWFHNACGTIYADTLDDAIACAYHLIARHDPSNAAQSCRHVERVGYNAAHGSDWVAPVPVAAQAGPNPILLDIAVPGAVPEHRAPAVDIPTAPQNPADLAYAQGTPAPQAPAPYSPPQAPAPFTPPTPLPERYTAGPDAVTPVQPSTGESLPSNPDAPDFGAGA